MVGAEPGPGEFDWSFVLFLHYLDFVLSLRLLYACVIILVMTYYPRLKSCNIFRFRMRPAVGTQRRATARGRR